MDLPYAPRSGQQDLVATIHDTQRRGRHAVLEAPTGLGKTITALVGTLRTLQETGGRALYITRTNSQQSQVVQEHKTLVDAGHRPGLLLPLMGRRQYCPLLRDDDRFKDGTPEELGRLCQAAKRKAVQAHEAGKEIQGACPYYQRLLVDGTGPVEALLEEGGHDAGSIARRVTACGSCPYEALKALLPKATTVVAPYIYAIDPRLRETVMQWIGESLNAVHLIVDEAHNLPEAARAHHSPRLTANSLARAVKEAEEHDDPTLAGRLLTTSLLHALQTTLWDLVADHVIEEDGRIPPGAVQERLMERLRVPTPVIARAARDLEILGEQVRESRRRQGRLPRSYLGTVGAFLLFWAQAEEEPYVHLVTGGDNPAIEAMLLEPSSVLGWLHECASTVHLSGTLAPTQEYVDRCGLPGDTVQKVTSSPFDTANLHLFGMEGVHRRWRDHQEDPRHAARQQGAALQCLQRMTGKTALFFPSHAMLADYVEEGLLHGIDRAMYREEPGMDTPAIVRLVKRFKTDPDPGALLLGVLGGRMTEGIDFPGEALQNMLIFGIPYPRPSARQQALIDHGDRIHDGRGWTYTVHNPVGRILRQAVGRLIRGPDDQGTCVVLDERVVRFRTHLPTLRMITEAAGLDAPLVPLQDGFNRAGSPERPSLKENRT